MIGSLSKVLMQKAVAFAGDATKPVTFTILNSTDYDPETGAIVKTETEVNVAKALMGRVTEADSKKYALTNTSHKVIVAMADYKATGLEALPEAEDTVLVNGIRYVVDKVVLGSMEHSLILFICEK